MINTILEERFAMANMVKHANLEIEKAKSISTERLEGFRILKQSSTVMQAKIENLEKEFAVVFGNVNDARLSG
jgi:hypothetical protein